MARQHNRAQFRLGAQTQELREYMTKPTNTNTKTNDKQSLQELLTTTPDAVTTYEFVKSRLLVPTDLGELKKAFIRGINLGHLAWTATGILYVAWIDRTPSGQQAEIDADILRNCPSIDAGFLRALDAIGRNRISYQFFTSRCPLYQRVIMTEATADTQDHILKTKTLLIPRKVTTDGKTKIVVEQAVDKDKISAWQSRIILPGKKLVQDKATILKEAQATLQVQKIKSCRWGFSDKNLIIDGTSFDTATVENIVTEYYTHLKDYRALQRLVLKLNDLLDRQATEAKAS